MQDTTRPQTLTNRLLNASEALPANSPLGVGALILRNTFNASARDDAAHGNAPRQQVASTPLNLGSLANNGAGSFALLSMFNNQNSITIAGMTSADVSQMAQDIGARAQDFLDNTLQQSREFIERTGGQIEQHVRNAARWVGDTANKALQVAKDAFPDLSDIRTPGYNSARAINYSLNNGVPVGFCARGVRLALSNQGITPPLTATGQNPNGHDYARALERTGDYVRLEVGDFTSRAQLGEFVQRLPAGTILCFDSDVRMGNAPRNNGGGKYGHVEIVSHTEDGRTLLVSDTARQPRSVGGSVWNNINSDTGNAGIYVRREVADQIYERLNMTPGAAPTPSGPTLTPM